MRRTREREFLALAPAPLARFISAEECADRSISSLRRSPVTKQSTRRPTSRASRTWKRVSERQYTGPLIVGSRHAFVRAPAGRQVQLPRFAFGPRALSCVLYKNSDHFVPNAAPFRYRTRLKLKYIHIARDRVKKATDPVARYDRYRVKCSTRVKVNALALCILGIRHLRMRRALGRRLQEEKRERDRGWRWDYNRLRSS